jgi:hypothetical protein
VDYSPSFDAAAQFIDDPGAGVVANGFLDTQFWDSDLQQTFGSASELSHVMDLCFDIQSACIAAYSPKNQQLIDHVRNQLISILDMLSNRGGHDK